MTNDELVKQLMGIGNGDFNFSLGAPPDVQSENGQTLLLTTDQAGHALQIGRSHLYKLLRRGEIKSIKIGRNRRIPVMELERYIEQEMDDGEEM